MEHEARSASNANANANDIARHAPARRTPACLFHLHIFAGARRPKRLVAHRGYKAVTEFLADAFGDAARPPGHCTRGVAGGAIRCVRASAIP